MPRRKNIEGTGVTGTILCKMLRKTVRESGMSEPRRHNGNRKWKGTQLT